MIDNFTLPKLDMKEFDLVPRNWVAFWGQFSRIHDDKRIREEDKFQYLLSSLKLKTKARDIVESYPPSKTNYAKVIEHLKSRFGRDDLLIEVYIRDLLTLVSNRATMKLAVLYDKLGTHLRALETLGVTTQNYAAMLYPVVESCLPLDVLKAWDRYRLNRESDTDMSRFPTKEKLLEELMTFLGNEVQGEEHRALADAGFGVQLKYKNNSNVPLRFEGASASALVSSVTHAPEKYKCIFCDSSHLSQDCGKASTMSREEKRDAVMRKRCCLVCLRPGHMAKTCRSGIRCLICEKRHYVILCPELRKKNEVISNAGISNKEDAATLFTDISPHRAIHLKTLLLRIRSGKQSQCARALLDDGSHRSYIEKNLVNELHVNPSGKEILSQGLFGGTHTPEAEHNRYDIVVESINRGFSCKISVLDQSKICSTLPRVRDDSLIRELKARGIELTDVGKETPPIRLLLGADVIGKILTGKIEILASGISAVETKFGWSVLGSGKRSSTINMVSLSLQNFAVPSIWDIESLGITDPIERKSVKLLEEETMTHFRETIKVNQDQRYEVSLPWLEGHPPLYSEYDHAEVRLRSITRRLLKENMYDSYDDIFQQWHTEGIIETVPENELSNNSHYLPHRPVIKMSSATTKVRPVFDASNKRPGYASLNECLSVGPSLIQQIPTLLIKFRTGAIGVTADIKQAFLQLSVIPNDRDFLRFLWWEDKAQRKLKFYRHCRVVFGVSSSPFLLNATIIHHLNSEKFQGEESRDTVENLKNCFYVDNIITSVDNEKELNELRSQAQEIMQAGRFELRCWAFNGMKGDQMLLGLKWNIETDELCCIKPKQLTNDDEIVTKRKLLSVINSVYDPIGFTCPTLLLPKLLLQEAWRNKRDWDEELPLEFQRRYKKWVKNINLIDQCTIPRRMLRGKHEEASLHIFTDASSNAYACCAFLRSQDESGVSVQLVSAKSRVAPMQKPTIPRLELLAATIGARLGVSIYQALQLPLKIYYWTDSMIVLSWIINKEPWNSFVGNRVKEIRDLTDVQNWRHVPGEINPADLPSRSCDWSELLRSQWWEGPDWLREPKENWPCANITLPDEALTERRKVVISAVNLQPNENFSNRFLYFSKYPKILRMIAWVLRFYKNSKTKEDKLEGILTIEEIGRAEGTIIKLIQREWALEDKERYSKSIQFYTRDDILRVKSRLILSNDPEEFTWPIVLPDHPIVRRLIAHTHEQLCHSGIQTTLSCLREKFWIPCGRRIVREVLRSCIICKRHSSKQIIPETSPLPPNRVNRVAAFQVTGIDLAGPLYLRGGGKTWIVLFTCGVYRAIHLELVTALSAEIFIQALRRFFARRGRSSVLYTDNGTNFSGTFRALQSLDWKEIQEKSATLKIKWYFSPPAAPWYGGWWERMVRSVKELLRKNLGRACLSYEEMSTLLCDIESTINNRPLTYLSDDPNELKPITPAHFIQDIRETENIDLDIVDRNYFSNRARYLQSLKERLRRRFKEEYLAELIRYPKGKVRRQDIQKGDIVLVGSDNTKRISWPLARVSELFTGKDGNERVARLKLADKEIIRPVQRLYPLEVKSGDLPCVYPENLRPSDKDDKDELNTCDNIVKTRSGRTVIKPKRFL